MIKGRLTEVSRNQVAGWAVDTREPERPLIIRVEVDGVQIAKVETVAAPPRSDDHPAALRRRLFRHTFTPPLALFEPHRLRVITGKAQRPLPNGEVEIPALVPGDFKQALADVMLDDLNGVFITAMPRSGTTLMMQRLAAHPQIIAALHSIYEHPMASYLADLARVSVAPAFAGQPVGLNAHFRDKNAVGPNPYYAPKFRRAFPSADAMDYFHQILVPERAYSTARENLRDFYKFVALQNRKLAPRYFAEKLETAAVCRASIRAMLPDAKEVVLIRDPRDLYASYKARYPDLNKLSVKQVRVETTNLLAAAEEQSPHLMVLRYEDLITHEQESLERVFGFLGLDSMVARDEKADAALFSRHGTSKSPSSSIGRWRVSLTPEEQQLCNAQLEPFLRHFDYALA